MSEELELSHVFAFTERREEVARFYEEILGARRERPHEDSVWFATGGARFVVHDPEDEPAPQGFVPWFHVSDLATTYARADSAGVVIGGMRKGYFLAKDPEGRVIGVRMKRE